MGDDELITTHEAARILGLHVETIRRWARDGRLPAVKVRSLRAYRVRRGDLVTPARNRRAS